MGSTIRSAQCKQSHRTHLRNTASSTRECLHVYSNPCRRRTLNEMVFTSSMPNSWSSSTSHVNSKCVQLPSTPPSSQSQTASPLMNTVDRSNAMAGCLNLQRGFCLFALLLKQPFMWPTLCSRCESPISVTFARSLMRGCSASDPSAEVVAMSKAVVKSGGGGSETCGQMLIGHFAKKMWTAVHSSNC